LAGELGNTQPGDGFLYRGNGILQTTGRGGHKTIGQACGVDFEGDPSLVTAAEHALKPALFEWTQNGLNDFADQDDIHTITRRINGGLNGLPERIAWLNKLKAQLGIADVAAAPGGDTASLQTSLNKLGADPQLVIDGQSGPATIAAIKAFQTSANLVVDGVAGPATLAAIAARLAQSGQ
jgi:putative chitinase